jgi:hypothetical protein
MGLAEVVPGLVELEVAVPRLLALAVGAGLQVMQTLMEADASALAV